MNTPTTTSPAPNNPAGLPAEAPRRLPRRQRFIGWFAAGAVLALVATVLLTPSSAEAKVNPTIVGQSCLIKEIAKGGDAKRCFSEAGYKEFGADFVAQQRRKKWRVTAGDSSSCCSARTLWAEVVLVSATEADKVVDRVFLIFERTGGDPKLRIARLTEDDPRKAPPAKR